MRLLRGVVANQVHRHVVGGTERRTQVVGAGCGQPGDPFEGNLALIHHDGVTQFIDAAPARPPRELGVLPRCQDLMPLALELPQILDDDGLGRHVDPQAQRLRREQDLHQARFEELLDRFLEHRQHPGMVSCDTGRQAFEELVEPECDQVVLVHPRGASLRDVPDPLSLPSRCQCNARLAEPSHTSVTPCSAEHEVDSREHAGLGQHLDNLFSPRNVDAPVTFSRARGLLVLGGSAAPTVVRLGLQFVLVQAYHVGVRQQDAVLFDMHRMQAPTHQVVMLQWDGTALLYDHSSLSAKRADPLSEFLGVTDGCR